MPSGFGAHNRIVDSQVVDQRMMISTRRFCGSTHTGASRFAVPKATGVPGSRLGRRPR